MWGGWLGVALAISQAGKWTPGGCCYFFLGGAVIGSDLIHARMSST